MNYLNCIKSFRSNMLMQAFCLVFLISFTSCGKEELNKSDTDLPIVLETLPVQILSSRQLILQSKVSLEGRTDVIDYGFLLYDLSDQAAAPIEISVGKSSPPKDSFEITYMSQTKMQIGQRFGYVGYVRTKKSFDKGKLVEFALDLVQVDIADAVLYGTIGDELVLSGNFEQMESSYYLTLSKAPSTRLAYHINESNDRLTLKIPSTPTFMHGDLHDLILHHKLPNGANYLQRKLAQVGLVAHIEQPPSSEIYFNDLLPIKGVGFPTPYYEKLNVVINGKSLHLNNQLRLSDFGPFEGTSVKWAIDYGHKIMEFKDPLTLKVPDGESWEFDQKVIHPFTSFLVSGVGSKRYFNQIFDFIRLGHYTAKYNSRDEENVNIAIDDIPDGDYQVTLAAPMYSVQSNATIRVRKFSVQGIDNPTVYPNQECVLRGSFVKGLEYVLEYPDHHYRPHYAVSDTEIRFNAPAGAGESTIKVRYYNTLDVNNNDLTAILKVNVLVPMISSITPLTVNAGEIITIKGKGLKGLAWAFFGNYSLNTEFVDEETLQLRIPYTLPPGRYKPVFETDYYTHYSNRGQVNPEITLEIL